MVHLQYISHKQNDGGNEAVTSSCIFNSTEPFALKHQLVKHKNLTQSKDQEDHDRAKAPQGCEERSKPSQLRIHAYSTPQKLNKKKQYINVSKNSIFYYFFILCFCFPLICRRPSRIYRCQGLGRTFIGKRKSRRIEARIKRKTLNQYVEPILLFYPQV